jgi:hypothetical protein
MNRGKLIQLKQQPCHENFIICSFHKYYDDETKDEMDWTCSPYVKYKKSIINFDLKPEGRPKCRWEDNIKIDLKEIGRVCGLD